MEPNERPQKVAVHVAQRIVQDVARDQLEPGDLLPPERVMLEKYQIGRGTLREALRLLEFQGMITLKPGPKGGRGLRSPDPSHLASSLLLLMQLRGAPFRAIVEVRTALEPVASMLAADRISRDELAELGASIEDMRADLNDTELFFASNKRFHDVIARASGNALLSYLVEAMLGIVDAQAVG